MSGLSQHPLVSKAEEVADEVSTNLTIFLIDCRVTCTILVFELTVCLSIETCDVSTTGAETNQNNFTHFGQTLLNFHLPGRWNPYVFPVEWAEGIHGHFLGLWKVSSHNVCHHQPVWPTGWLFHGPVTLESWYCLCPSLWHCLYAGTVTWTHFVLIIFFHDCVFLDCGLQYSVGSSISVPKLGADRSSLACPCWKQARG